MRMCRIRSFPISKPPEFQDKPNYGAASQAATDGADFPIAALTLIAKNATDSARAAPLR
jgi:hypothetical protein